MPDHRQERIKELFQTAAQRRPAERSAYLQAECGADADLRSAVESLLAAGDDAGSFLERPPLLSPGSLEPGSMGPGGPGTSGTTRTSAPAFGAAQLIDRYRLLEKLGEGGMGEVWLAEQQQPVRRKVALKVIKAGMDTVQVISRFEAERQALAMMDHPAIAKVFDAGATSAGRPYFVMEHVQGLPITQHCDRQRLGIADRLELFIQVCEGVQHAHQKAVLHRDLKPSNVLVASHDGRAIPKIIDFGVAKAMAQPLIGDRLHTGLGVLIGTPGYMSPEQADLSGRDVDTRTDVYSLGVMLYELLVGVLPFDSRKLKQVGWEGLGELLRDTAPATPSRRFNTLPPEASAESASRRQADTQGLRRRLTGDLDRITMKAIESDRERRYRSPSDLAEDIRRHLRNEPVLAGSPGAAYRMRKFVLRHRLGVAAACIVTLAVGAGLVGTTAGLVRARRYARTSERVSGFLSNVLASIQPERMGQTMMAELRKQVEQAERARGSSEEQVVARIASFDDALSGVNQVDLSRQIVDKEILAPAGRTIEDEMAGEPLVAARLQSTTGWTYHNLGLFPAAEAFHLRALETRRRILGPEHPDTLQSSFGLARAYHAQKRFAEAEKILEEAYEIQRRVLGPEHPDTLQSMGRLGAAIHDQGGRYDESEALFRESVSLRRRVLGEDHPDTAIAMRYLADSLSSQKRYVEAEQVLLDARDRLVRALGPEHQETLVCMNNLANMYAAQGRDQEAERIRLSVLETRIRVFGKDHYMTGAALANLARTYIKQGRYDEAQRLLEAAIGSRADDSSRVSAIILMANLHLRQNRPKEAEALYREALDIRRRILGDDHADTVAVMKSLGETLRFQMRYSEAVAIYRDVLEWNRRIRGPEHEETNTVKNALGYLYFTQGRHEEAEKLLEEVVAVRRRDLAEDSQPRVIAVVNLADVYVARRRYDDAQPLYEEVLDMRRHTLGADDPSTLRTLDRLVKLHWSAGNPETARSLLQSALVARKRAAERPEADAASKNQYAWSLLTCEPVDLRNPREAMKFAAEAVAATNRRDAAFLDTLALAQHMTGSTAEALRTQQEAIALLPEGPSREQLQKQRAKYLEALRK